MFPPVGAGSEGSSEALAKSVVANYFAESLRQQLQTTAEIMANEGQHLVVLREALHRPPVPSAFEIGKA